ncbi:response regulator [Celeribacter sp.]|uniref:response regulator n=1 Tax=Celeribacter sp. TaxID=1890673 RepID=UPI003A935006
MARILIADDDADYRRAFTAGMTALGHDVVSVTSGSSVPDALNAAPDGFDVVFLDIMMPDGGGATALHHVKSFDPDLPAVIITGRAELFDSPIFKRGFTTAEARIKKTVSLAELDTLVRDILGI